LVAELKVAIRGLEVIRRDLDANPIPHLDSKRLPTVRPANAPAGAVADRSTAMAAIASPVASSATVTERDEIYRHCG
jgi:FMN-dependent NADH-azoreductase